MDCTEYRICLQGTQGDIVDMPLIVDKPLNEEKASSLKYTIAYKAAIEELSKDGHRPVLLYRVSRSPADAEPAVPDYLVSSLGIPTAVARPADGKLTLLSTKRSKRICQTIIFA